MSKLNLLNDASIALLKELVTAEFARRDNSQLRNPSDLPTIQSPELYIAYAPHYIKGLDPITGIPGTADCKIYRYDLNDQKLVQLSDYVKTVVNYSQIPMYEGYFSVLRDKFGTWMPATPASTGDFLFKLFNVDCVDLTAMGHPIRGPVGTRLPPDPQFCVDGQDINGTWQSLGCWLGGGNPAMIEGQYAWCEEIASDAYGYGERTWAIKIMCGLGPNCAP